LAVPLTHEIDSYSDAMRRIAVEYFNCLSDIFSIREKEMDSDFSLKLPFTSSEKENIRILKKDLLDALKSAGATKDWTAKKLNLELKGLRSVASNELLTFAPFQSENDKNRWTNSLTEAFMATAFDFASGFGEAKKELIIKRASIFFPYGCVGADSQERCLEKALGQFSEHMNKYLSSLANTSIHEPEKGGLI